MSIERNGGAYKMEIGLIGLGKMGMNLAVNLKEHGHVVVGYDVNEIIRNKIQAEGIQTVSSIDLLLEKLQGDKKVVWLMLPSGTPTEDTINELKTKLNTGDILIEAGNSNFKDSMRRANVVKEFGIQYLDVGTSGGLSGARNGACLMIGGEQSAYEYVKQAFLDVSIESGCLYTGASGSGHFMKMVHNGIEYGMMQAIGEGFQIMAESDFGYDLEKVAENWNHGSVIRSWLMEIVQDKFSKNPHLENYKGSVDASGEAKWTIETALEMEVPIPVIALSLMMRNRSKESDSFSAKVVAAMRNGFGGHSFVENEVTDGK